MTNKEKFLALVSKEETKTVERAKARIANKSYSQISNAIAFEILEQLEELKWKQKDLAEKMNVSPQQVNKWVKGYENFTLETLVKLSKVLGRDLIVVPVTQDKQQANYISQNQIVSKNPYKNHGQHMNLSRVRTTLMIDSTKKYDSEYLELA